MIICKDWADVKDKVKSLKHIIQKCDPPTPTMPLMATGATVLGMYSHVKYPNRLKVQNRNKPEVEVNLKENLKNKDITHLKPKRQMKLIHMIALTIITTMILTLPQDS